MLTKSSPAYSHTPVLSHLYLFSLQNISKYGYSTYSTALQFLYLADGTVHYGQAFGKIGTTSGEICFNTGMTGYQEVFTDPSYYGQVLIMNSVHIGNYGVKDADVESDSVKIRGLIGRNLEEQFSRIQAKGSLDDYLKANQIVCIEGVDTRALVTHVRLKGAMNCIISSEITDVNELKKMLSDCTADGRAWNLLLPFPLKKPMKLVIPIRTVRIAVLDYGIKKNIIQCMIDRGRICKSISGQNRS